MNRKDSLKHKLFRWFGFLIIVLVGVVVIGFLGTIKTYNIVTVELAKSLIYGDAKDAIRALDQLTNLQGPMVLSLDRSFSNYVGGDGEALPKFKKALNDMDKAVKKLNISLKSPADKKLADELNKTFESYRKNNEVILKLAGEGQYTEASSKYESHTFTEEMENMGKTLDKIIEHNRVDRASLKRKQDIALPVIWAIMGIVLFLALALSLTIIPYVTKNITTPLYQCVRFAEALSEGDLTGKLNFEPNRIVGPDSEIGHMCESLMNMSVKLHAMLERVNKSTTSVNRSSLDITAGAQSILQGTQVQSDSITDVSNNVQQLTSAIDTIAENSKVMNASAQETAKSVDKMIESIYKIDESVADLTSQVSNTTAVIAEMSASTAQVHNSARVMAEAVQETSSTIEEMLASIEEVSLNAKEMDR